MNKKQRLIGILGTVLIVCVISGAASCALTSVIDISVPFWGAFLCALAAAAVCAIGTLSAPAAIAGIAISVLGIGAYIAANLSAGGSVNTLINGIRAMSETGDIASVAASSALISEILAVIFAVIFCALISERSGIGRVLAAVMCISAVIIPAAAANTPAIYVALGMAGGCAAIAHTPEQRRTGRHIMALIPAAVAALIALAIAPSSVTWAPLENAAEKVRQMYEDYFNYTHERTAYSILTDGYDYYSLKDDEPTHMLGGPADPSRKAVMQVRTDDDMLLRGTVRGVYTGYSWEDGAPKKRNLYYDFTRRSKRKEVFGADKTEKYAVSEAFRKVAGEVTLLADGASTLFVPARLADMDMPLTHALYYNSSGELFLSRDTVKGDSYAFTAWETADIAALASIESLTSDNGYIAAAREYTALPGNVEDGVYDLARKLTKDCNTDADSAIAIMNGLKKGCKYKLDVGYPPQDRDFVSYFLLDSREGYCSYFASAMAVLCRAQGIPARYVEGYRVYAENDGVTTVTGENAHAWTEVYINGVGWVAFDPTPGRDDPTADDNSDEGAPEPSDEPIDEPTPEPTQSAGDNSMGEPTPEPSDAPTSEPDSQPTSEPTSAPDTQPTSEPTSAPDTQPTQIPETRKARGIWLWILIIVAAVIAAALIIRAWLIKRLRSSDPVRIAAGEDSDTAAAVMYRSILTLLSRLGYYPAGGETPSAFAERLEKGGFNAPGFTEFAAAYELSRYSRAGADKRVTAMGIQTYLSLRRGMKRTDRLKFDIYRIFKGLGNFNSIP